jgi:hypothetical protein
MIYRLNYPGSSDDAERANKCNVVTEIYMQFRFEKGRFSDA